MALGVQRERFTEADVANFRRRLQESLVVLEEVLGRPGFGLGEMTMGAELEVSVVDREGRALGRQSVVCARTDRHS